MACTDLPVTGIACACPSVRPSVHRIGRKSCPTVLFPTTYRPVGSTAFAVASFMPFGTGSFAIAHAAATIAASILVGAGHAIRPLFGGREALVAGLFGLGHGLAFSFTPTEMQLSIGRLALSLLGFNVGIELVQLLLVGLALPTVLILTRPWLRVTGAAATAIVATGWLFDRLGSPNVVARVADGAGTHTGTMLAILAAAAVLAGVRLVPERRNRTASTEMAAVSR